MAEPLVRLGWRPFRLPLARPLVTAQGTLAEKRGWLLRLEPEGPDGALGWGEAAPLLPGAALDEEQQAQMAAAIDELGRALPRQSLEEALPSLPAELGFALGMALAETDGLVGAGAGGWLPPPASALLLPAGPAALTKLEAALASTDPAPALLPTFKWKVATIDDALERTLLEALLKRLPPQAHLRLDANGGWDRATAAVWADRLAEEPRLQWLEQPLDPGDQAGLEALATRLPVALDESLRQRPELRRSWPGWQVRRPALEGDPRPLLARLQAGAPRLMLSTAFETGIGRRWLHHLAALQQRGPTPAAPGLAPGWSPGGPLAAPDPELVWEAA
jgi:O-succinylbenzoate synthase